MNEIAFSVIGYPPAKGEALSMFGAGHRHIERVKVLLTAAQKEIAGTPFQPFTGPIGLEVMLRAPDTAALSDATNYLGGIADSLQHKGRVGISLDHLGDLALVALYLNDRQIREIHYRQEDGELLGYRVRIWALAKAS